MGKRVTRIYACGGGAIKITADLVDYTNIAGFSDTKVSRLDTSDKNLTPNMSQSSIFLLENADGSGKQRDHNYKPVVGAMSKILAQHQPEDYNIVLFTAGGGSGSVIGPVLVGELLQRKAPVIALVIGTTGDETQAQNSVNTIKSLGGIQAQHKRPLIFAYFEVNQNNSQSDVDRQVRALLPVLLNLLDSNNSIIDNKDIVNFLDWTNVRKDLPAQLACLEVYNGDELDELTGKAPITMASIYPDAERKYLPVTPAYSTDGIRSELPAGHEFAPVTLHYVIQAGPIKPIFAALENTLQRIRDTQRAQAETSNVVGNDDNVENTGMVL
ncbi:hypothetical protein pEaSNUABM37_00241 [Erwinia phage pEa_SNUABM_37]|nr:hypothetical protein pEaSNUABM37_00241 [Erwinia phage pEa_SNUABM_37]QXO10709.1 hypothetical protein pEaSNUABM48_00241 [Erwinia phage pEa_SNUABM_48]